MKHLCLKALQKVPCEDLRVTEVEYNLHIYVFFSEQSAETESLFLFT